MSMSTREVKKIVESHGLQFLSMVQHNHIKVRVRTKRGTERTVIFPCSMGDKQRGWKNKSAQLRNIAKE